MQGVYFRQSAKKRAEELNVQGNVRNLHDGKVMIVAEGEEASLYEFYKWCQEGPPLAMVSEVKFEEGELKNFIGFSIVKSH